MLSSQMTGKTPGNHDTVSRNKACCILAARQELKLKGKERLLRKLDLRSHNSTSNCCHPGFFTHTCRSTSTKRKMEKKQLSSTSLRHLSTAIHIQPGSTSKRPPRTFSCDELCRLDCVLRSKTWRIMAHVGYESRKETRTHRKDGSNRPQSELKTTLAPFFGVAIRSYSATQRTQDERRQFRGSR